MKIGTNKGNKTYFSANWEVLTTVTEIFTKIA